LPRSRSLVLVLIVALPVASAAGCFGDEETSQTESPAPTRQEFIAQADAICRSAEQDLGAVQGDVYTADGLDEEEAELVEEEVIPIFHRQLDEIRELTPPPDDKGEIEAALSAAERDLDDLLEDPNSVPTGLREFNRLFQRYGSNTSSGCG
jgi:hypothetical protein